MSFLDQVYIDVYGVSVRFLSRKTVLVSFILLSAFTVPSISSIKSTNIIEHIRVLFGGFFMPIEIKSLSFVGERRAHFSSSHSS